MSRNVLIAGGSGLIGREITKILLQQGDEVAWLSRKPNPGKSPVSTFLWNPAERTIDPEAMNWATHIINLAGESIGETHWTEAGKSKILDSRIHSVETLIQGMKLRKEPLEAFVGVSGLGFYGPSIHPRSENENAGEDFPAQVALAWENAYSKIGTQLAQRTCVLRLTVVLSTKGGALPLIMSPIKWGVGAVLGSGKQPFSWIHLEDACQAFVHALDWSGTINLAAPDTQDNRYVTEVLGQLLHRPLWLPAIPAWTMKLALGDRSELVLTGTTPNLTKLKKTGFTFQFPVLEDALSDLISRKA